MSFDQETTPNEFEFSRKSTSIDNDQPIINESMDTIEKTNISDWEYEEENRLERIKKSFSLKKSLKALKYTCRYGISSKYRKEIWFTFSGGEQLFDDIKINWDETIQFYSNPNYTDIIQEFGCPNSYDFFTPKEDVNNILTIIRNLYHNMHFSPLIPSVVSMLKLYLPELQAYYALQAMIRNKERKYFSMNKETFIASISTMGSIISTQAKKVFAYTNTFKLTANDVVLFILPLFFTNRLDRNVSLTIFDSYIYEGKRVLVRYIIGSILILQKQLMKTTSALEFINIIYNYFTSIHDPQSLHELTEKAFAPHLRGSKRIHQDEQKFLLKALTHNYSIGNILPTIDEFQSFHQFTTALDIPTKCLSPYSTSRPRASTTPSNQISASAFHTQICASDIEYTTSTINQSRLSDFHNGKLISDIKYVTIRKQFPLKYRIHEAYPVYLMSQDGTSFTAFYSPFYQKPPFLLVIKASQKTFGAIISTRLRSLSSCYIGDGFTCVIDFDLNKVYTPTGKNTFFISMDKDAFMMGGPQAAIYLSDGFRTVYSDICDTFNSPSFTGSRGDLVYDIEIYKLAI